jgi:hypothetical protein
MLNAGGCVVGVGVGPEGVVSSDIDAVEGNSNILRAVNSVTSPTPRPDGPKRRRRRDSLAESPERVDDYQSWPERLDLS